ncbi:MAG: oligosaccharide flippase family protein, partial [Ginsengibacter sp.]
MKQRVLEFIKHPLIYGSGIVVIGGLAANFLNFLFNLFMSRSLSVADYGTLASLTSLIGFPALIITAVMPLVVRFAGDYFATNRLDLVRGLYIKMAKFLIIIGFVFFILFLIFVPSISNFFHIENKILLIITDLIIFSGFLAIINIAMLQAKLAFGYQMLVNLIGAVVKLSLGVLFVYLGYSVTGSALAILMASVSIYIFSFFPIKFIFNKKISASPHVDTKELFVYGIPSALTLFGLTSLISTDVILVKHFFDPKSAGIYAGLSLMGRVIFYISSPIGSVMFPIIVQKHSKKESYKNTLNISLVMVFLSSLAITIFYFLFPKFSILFFLKRNEYLSIVPL